MISSINSGSSSVIHWEKVDFDKDHIFEIFRKFAQNYLFEIYGRHKYGEDKSFTETDSCIQTLNKYRVAKGKPVKNYLMYCVSRKEETICSYVAMGLMTALFGRENIPDASFNLDNAKRSLK